MTESLRSPVRCPRPGKAGGYVIIILMIAVFAIEIGLLIALPVWQTELQREKEEELIFRGRQYVEAVRRYQLKHQGEFPADLDSLVEEKLIRKLYREPLTRKGEWLLILVPPASAQARAGTAPASMQSSRAGGKFQEVMIVPAASLGSFRKPRILGVMSPSVQRSVKIYNEQDSYDKWLFFFGQDPKKLPKMTYFEED